MKIFLSSLENNTARLSALSPMAYNLISYYYGRTRFFLANMADIYLFEALKKQFPNALWLRNNVASIVCNCSENFLFVLAAFYGIYSFSDCMSIAAATSIIEAIIAVCDTPFVYAARKI